MEGRYVSVVIPGRREYLTLCEVEVYGEKLPDPTGVNLAKSGEADQSSTFSGRNKAQAATDGIKLSEDFIHPCAGTNMDHPAWWRLDLKKRYRVRTVIIVTRRDLFSERLLGAEIRVGDSPDNNNPVCGTVTKGTKAIITLCCEGMEGRYVSVVIPGRAENLQLCEVEVYGEESTGYKENLARSGDVRQSSMYRAEHRAQETNSLIHPCTQTDYDNPAWCGTVTDVSQLTITLCCNGMEGRYVSVVIPGREEFLSLCEVEVYGEEATTQRASVSNIAMAHLFIHPCAHTNNYNLTWWRLDLKKRYKVQKVVIVHRLDEHKEHLLGSEIRVGDSVDINNPVCGTITEVSTGSITVPCEGMAGYYVTVLIRHSAEYLQLSEVEVYGEESADYKGVNLARRGEVAQSSTFISSHVAETAIDGIKLTDLSIYPCAHTNDDKSPWWRLDLKSRFAVEYVFLVYRMDDKRERLLGAEIRIGDSADNKNAV
ncbi:hypothetical protein XENTR_v10017338 [Xenopus tropicalis]|nr:hypothetical protein XENTR_v10017338 [Xenopus tropicalis]